MLRFWTACLALLLTPLATASAKELKPKFGNIDGVYYSDVSGEREACRQAIKNKMALCRQNTNFVSNTKNREHAGCLPVFRQQAESCAVHFRHQMSKCELSGPARITDFTGFGCTVTKKVVEDGSEREDAPGVAPADRWMRARTRANLRSGPGTDHAKVGLLEAGEEVLVTGEAGEWLRIRGTDGSTAFVHGSLLVPPPPQGRDATAALSPKCAGMSQGAECWWELTGPPGCYLWYAGYHPSISLAWSGACRKGVAGGQGTLTATWSGGSVEAAGAIDDGKLKGRWVLRDSDGHVDEGPYVDGKKHGYWVERWSDGTLAEGPYVNGERHGPWIWDSSVSGHFPNVNRIEFDYYSGSAEGRQGVIITKDGKRIRGRISGGCLRDNNGAPLQSMFVASCSNP